MRAANRPANALHSLAVRQVKASAQAQAVGKLMPLLDAEELAVYKRGRNAHPGHIPKKRVSSGLPCSHRLEALVGLPFILQGAAGTAAGTVPFLAGGRYGAGGATG